MLEIFRAGAGEEIAKDVVRANRVQSQFSII